MKNILLAFIFTLFMSIAHADTAILQSSDGNAINASNPLQVTIVGSITAAAGWTKNGTDIYTTTQGDNVGIGTLTPSAELEIESTAANDLLRVSDNGPTDTTPAFNVDQNGNVSIGTGTANSQLIVMSGNVGIATTTANALLDVSSTAAQDLVRVNDNGTGDTTPAIVVDQNGNVAVGTGVANSQLIVMSGNVGIATTTANAFLDISSTAAQNMIRINDNGTGDTSPFIIDQAGNVSIGTTLSNDVLTIKGNVGIGTTVSYANSSGITVDTGTDANYWSFRGMNANGLGGIRLDYTGTQAAGRNYLVTGGYQEQGDFIIRQSNALGGDPNSSGTNRFMIRASGNIGIGSNSAKALLDLGTSSTPLTMPGIKSSSGTRYLCIGTDGQVTSSATACSGT